MSQFRVSQCSHRKKEKDSILDSLLKNSNYPSLLFHDGKCWKTQDVDSIFSKYTKNINTEHKGERGLQGFRGLQGEKGEQGLMGPRGPPGIKGDSPFIGDEINKTTSIGLECCKSGKSSVYIGYQCGSENVGDENTYIGFQSGIVNSGGLNTFIGAEAGKFSSGNQNTYIGNNSCSFTGSNGSYNLFAGSESGFHNTSGFGNVFLGSVSGASNTEGSWNVFIGQSSGHGNDTGTNNIFVGANSGISNVSGTNNICIGDNSDTSSENPQNQVVIGQGVVSYGDNTITFPSNLKTFPSGTEVNFSSPYGGCLYPVSSSIRWKNNIKDISSVIDTSQLYNLRPVVFNPAIGHGNPEEVHIGLIAEEVERCFPNIVPKDNSGRPCSVRYSLLGVLLIEELKKLKNKYDIELTDIKNKIDFLINEQ